MSRHFVIAGLDPVTHPQEPPLSAAGLDARVKPGHDAQ